jgi:hypothetical protein
MPKPVTTAPRQAVPRAKAPAAPVDVANAAPTVPVAVVIAGVVVLLVILLVLLLST